MTFTGCRRGLLLMPDGSHQQNNSDEDHDEDQALFQVDEFKPHFGLRSRRRPG